MEEYKILGYAVLKQAVYDYYKKIKKGYPLQIAERQLDINNIWFEVTKVNKKWFYEQVHKKGREIWEQQKKNI